MSLTDCKKAGGRGNCMEGTVRNCSVSGLEVLFNETGSGCVKVAWIKAE